MSNPDSKLKLHWLEELEQESENIVMMYDINLLKYSLQKPKTWKTTEVWSDGKNKIYTIHILLKRSSFFFNSIRFKALIIFFTK